LEQVVFCFDKSQVIVEASNEMIERCLLHLTPFFNVSTNITDNSEVWRVKCKTIANLEHISALGGIKVKIAHGEKIYLKDKHLIQFHQWPVQIEVRPLKREVTIKGKKSKEIANTLWRVIRQILIFSHEYVTENFSLFHSSAMSYNNQIVAFMSPGAPPGEILPSRHGKSFALLSCLTRRRQKFSFFTDDLLLVWIEKGKIKIAGYPDYLGVYLQEAREFPEIFGYGQCDEIRQYLLPQNLLKLGIQTFSGPSESLTHIFFTNLQKPHPLKIQPINKKEAFRRIIEAVRYDHLYSDLYNPNWLDLPRKTIKQITNGTKTIAENLIKQEVNFFILEGTASPEEIAKTVEIYLKSR
jgi:hypothetical protein